MVHLHIIILSLKSSWKEKFTVICDRMYIITTLLDAAFET